MAFLHFPAHVVTQLHGTLRDSGTIPSPVVQHLLDQTGYNIQQMMIALLPIAAQYARTPVSDFHVGAVLRGQTTDDGPGNLYFGANMEFSGQTMGASVHAEQSAINTALLSGETGLQAIAVNAAPCGHCRQFLHEASNDQPIYIILPIGDDLTFQAKRLADYLPDPFGPADLNIANRLFQTQDNGLTLNTDDTLMQAALHGANTCYAPYSNGYAGLAAKRSDGQVFIGRLIENAAYNPTLAPLQSALAYMNVCRDLADDHRITDVALVETAQAPFQHYQSTKAILKGIAPDVQLRYHQI